MQISEGKLIACIAGVGFGIFSILLLLETQGLILIFILPGILITLLAYRFRKPVNRPPLPLAIKNTITIEPPYLKKVFWGILFLPCFAFLLWVLSLVTHLLPLTLPPLRTEQEGLITKKMCLVDYPAYPPDMDLKQCKSAGLYTYYITYIVSGKKYEIFDAPVVAGKGPGTPSKLYTNNVAVGDTTTLYIEKNDPSNNILVLNLLTESMAVTFLLTLALILCIATGFPILKSNK